MPVLRLFAAAREAAGTASVEVPGVTVDEVLAAARARFGPQLGAVIDASKVWRNGEPATGTDPVGPGDEVAVLPPVSGGSGPDRPRGGASRRPTFTPAEPPPPARPAPAPRRSPRAEAAAPPGARRRDPGSPDRPAPRRASETTPPAARRRPGRPRAGGPGGPRRDPGPVTGRATPDGSAPAARRPGPSGRGVPAGSAPGGRRPDLAKREPKVRRTGATPPPLAPGVLTRTTAPTGTPLAAEEADDANRRATRLTRMRSVGVPITGSITVRGKERPVSGMRPRRTAFGRRYAVVYDTDGPKVTLGVIWFVAMMGAVAMGWWALTFLFGIAAGWAAMEAADRWRERGVAADPWVAALGAGAVAAAGAAGAGFVGAAILAVVVASVGRMAMSPMGRDHVLSAAGNTVGCAIPFGLASASVVLANDLEIGAVVALLLFVAAYDAGDHLIGTGSSNSVEGPLAGIVTIGVVAMAIAVLGTPPFEGVPTYTFAAFAAVLCPLGQMAASAILPANDARAPSVRRLDSFLLLAPVWVWSVGIFMASR
ncbi:MAG TPA: MoaD/ThiS family protein [Iamia sp.]|nr:MoaD/ThiS family protein [Iamia sp.]